MNIASILWLFIDVFVFAAFRYHMEIESESVDWVFILSSIVLKNTCQEGLSEEETRNPEVGWRAIFNPFLHEFESLDKVVDVASKRFQAGIGNFEPNSRHLVIKNTIEYSLKFLTHNNEAIDSLVDIDEE